jgi:hypothetical protein
LAAAFFATGFSAAVFALAFVDDEGAPFAAAFAAGFLAVAIFFSFICDEIDALG